MKKNLMQFLAAPSRIANALDWNKGAVLAVDIGTDRMCMALAPHPATNEPIRTLELALKMETRSGNRRVLSKDCVQSMASIVSEHNVCGFVISWPVQSEGRCGAPCGKVLFTLDSLLEESNNIVTKGRPFCLWDDQHVESKLPPISDSFGRDPAFANATRKTIHRASKEQYVHHECSSKVAAQVWQDFCQSHWPEIYQAHHEPMSTTVMKEELEVAFM
jgi:RNase H-fold protein (predicted Holliday junction resolvase)